MHLRFAVLTGGGDSSGINDFLYFLAQRLEREGHSLIGFRRSWLGLVNNDAVELDRKSLAQYRFTAGTLLGTERKNPIKDGQMDLVLNSLKDWGVDVLIAMGGDDTLGVANHLAQMGFTVVGVAQTIDDLTEAGHVLAKQKHRIVAGALAGQKLIGTLANALGQHHQPASLGQFGRRGTLLQLQRLDRLG